MNVNNENDKKKSITIDSIETINAAFVNKAADLKLSSMNSIECIELIHKLAASGMNITMPQSSVSTSLNNKILTEAMTVEAIMSEHTENENIDQVSVMSSAKFFKLNC